MHANTCGTISCTKRINVIRAEIRDLERLGPCRRTMTTIPGSTGNCSTLNSAWPPSNPLSQWRRRECWPHCSRRMGARVTAWHGPWFTSSALSASTNTRKSFLISVPKSGAGISSNGRGMRNPNINEATPPRRERRCGDLDRRGEARPSTTKSRPPEYGLILSSPVDVEKRA